MNIRKILLLFCVVYFSISLFGQNDLKEKRVYLLDVTKSMEGKGSVSTPNVFDNVKGSLISAIDEIEDPQTEIVVVPFTNRTHKPIHGYISNKDSLKKELSKLTVLNGNTNIADAWSAGMSLIDSTKVNYIFLITDGLHNSGPSKQELYSRLQKWDSVRKGKNYFSFYIMLTENAEEQNIRNIADSLPQMWSIRTLNIKAALIRTSMSQRANVFENKTVCVKFKSNNKKVFIKDLGVNISLQENPYYEVVSTRQSKKDVSIYEFDVREKLPKIQIPVSVDLKLHIRHNSGKYPLVFFTPEDVDIKFINRGVRRMNIKVLDLVK